MNQSVSQSTTASRVSGLGVIVMAAGLGKRMKSKHVKVLHPVAGRPMVLYVVDVALRLADHRIAVVVGHQSERVRQVIETDLAGKSGSESVRIVQQVEQLGTGHAVMQSRSVFYCGDEAHPTNYLILNGDTPLLKEETARELLRAHQSQGATVTILTAMLDDPSGYGRVIRRQLDGHHQCERSPLDVLKIVEDRDATEGERATKEVNVGTYVVSGEFLFDALDKLEPHNAQREYYLTDIVRMAVAQGRRVAAVTLQDPEEGLGVNTRQQLAAAERVVRQRICTRWLDAGVTMRDPGSVWIDVDAVIGRDTVLYPNVTLEGKTVIGEETTIHSGVRVTNCVIGNRVEILDSCVLVESEVEDEAHLGPFVHLRPGVVIRRKAKVGNFVEMKKTELGEGSKANHLSYLGDATIAEGVNIGAGTITCNYDGARKHRTVIGKNVFLGSDTQLIAPVTIGDGSVVAAGTTVTQNVPADSLAIARVAQTNRIGWAAKRRKLLTTGTFSQDSTKGSDGLKKQKNLKTSGNSERKRATSAKR
jgi:bifunctional UDP-N-acetylglucosamine pyrophosphorylase/glucosamine-1-phosphate N-acetyltransferase